jgi:hypothetical protein
VARAAFADSVFINVPFDGQYRPMFHALVFAVHDCGFKARCAREADDGSVIRIDKLYRIIEGCRFGIHDLSRTQLDPVNRLPRFNMPLELGIFLGAKRYGAGRQKRKNCLILDKEFYRIPIFCSDIAGQDPRSHGGTIAGAIAAVRDWLRTARSGKAAKMPGSAVMVKRYRGFRRQLPRQAALIQLDPPDKMSFSDYATCVVGWLDRNR